MARFIYRLADFLPAVLKDRETVLDWTEVVSGMLRMLFASEILDALVGQPAPVESPRGKIQSAANQEINAYHPEWYGRLLVRIAKLRGETEASVADRAARVMATPKQFATCSLEILKPS